MAQQKRPEPSPDFTADLNPARQRRALIKSRTFQIPTEHLEGIREGLVQIERGDVLDDEELDALLAPEAIENKSVGARCDEHSTGHRLLPLA